MHNRLSGCSKEQNCGAGTMEDLKVESSHPLREALQLVRQVRPEPVLFRHPVTICHSRYTHTDTGTHEHTYIHTYNQSCSTGFSDECGDEITAHLTRQ